MQKRDRSISYSEIQEIWMIIKEKTNFHKLTQTSARNRYRVFIRYCQKIINLYNEHTINIKQAAYALTSAIQFDELQNDLNTKEILSIAGELDGLTSIKQEAEEWSKLVNIFFSIDQVS